MIKKPITVQISNGLKARPVAMLVQVASQFESKIQVESGQKVVNAKSIMNIAEHQTALYATMGTANANAKQAAVQSAARRAKNGRRLSFMHISTSATSSSAMNWNLYRKKGVKSYIRSYPRSSPQERA